MLLPLGLYKKDYIVIGDIDWQFNVTKQGVVANTDEALSDIADSIADPLEKLCFEAELRHITANGIRVGRRLLCLVGGSDRLTDATMTIRSDGVKECISDGLKHSRFATISSPELYALNNMTNWHSEIKYLESIMRMETDNSSVDTGVSKLKMMKVLSPGKLSLSFSDGSSQQATDYGLESAKWYILIDRESKYPLIVTECNGRLYRLPIVYSTTTYCYHNFYKADKEILQETKRDLHTIRCRLMNSEAWLNVLYPKLDSSNLDKLLSVLSGIKPALVAPFYIAFKAWLGQDGDARRIMIGDKHFWTAVDDVGEFGDALSIYGLGIERSLVYKSGKFYELNTHTDDLSKLIQNSTGDLYYKTRGTLGRVLINLTGLKLMENSVLSLNSVLLYYINELNGAERNWSPKQLFLDDKLELYITPNNSNDILIDLIENAWVGRSVLLTINHNEWYSQGKREQLSALLAELCLDAQDATQEVTIKVRFIADKVQAVKDFEDVTIEELFTVEFEKDCAMRIILSSDARDLADHISFKLHSERQIANRIQKDVIRGILKSLGVVRGQAQNTCCVRAGSVRTRQASEINYTVVDRAGKVYGCYDNTHFQFEVDGTVNSLLLDAHKLSNYVRVIGSNRFVGLEELENLRIVCIRIFRDAPTVGMEKYIISQLNEPEIHFTNNESSELFIKFRECLEKLWASLDM